MHAINWKVRVQSKSFWISLVSAFLLLVQACAAPFGYQWDFGMLGDQIAAIVNALFGIFAIIGITVDPTTAGIADSKRALEYDEPAQ